MIVVDGTIVLTVVVIVLSAETVLVVVTTLLGVLVVVAMLEIVVVDVVMRRQLQADDKVTPEYALKQAGFEILLVSRFFAVGHVPCTVVVSAPDVMVVVLVFVLRTIRRGVKTGA